MSWHRIFLAVVATLPLSLLPSLGLAQSSAPRVYSDAGNIFIEKNGAKTKLTSSEMDVDPVLAPERRLRRLHAAGPRPHRPWLRYQPGLHHRAAAR